MSEHTTSCTVSNCHTCTQPPRQEGMRREAVEAFARDVMQNHECGDECGDEWRRLLSHDAAQRETIARLERERDATRFLLNRAMADLTKSQERQAASEAKHKWTRERPTVPGWYWWRDAHTSWVFKIELHPDLEVWCYREAHDLYPIGDIIGGKFQGPLTPGGE